MCWPYKQDDLIESRCWFGGMAVLIAYKVVGVWLFFWTIIRWWCDED